MTLGKPDVSAQARLDLGAQVRWLRLHADRHIARNFAVSATQTFLKIASQPGLGAEVHSSNLRLLGVRKWRVDGFPKVLIFYRQSEHGIAIIRVLHAA